MTRIDVAVAIIFNPEGQCLVSLRQQNQHLAGLWEFPGGKAEPGESMESALRREIHEELGLQVEDSEPFMVIEHDYPEKRVRLDIRKVTRYSGSPQGREGQPLKWLEPGEMKLEDFPEANQAIIKKLQNSL